MKFLFRIGVLSLLAMITVNTIPYWVINAGVGKLAGVIVAAVWLLAVAGSVMGDD